MSELAESDRPMKREYLQREIVDCGLDTSLFTDFCEKQKSSNLDHWSFEELKTCVAAFKAQLLESEPPTSPPEDSVSATEPNKDRHYTLPARPIPPTELFQVQGLEVTVTK